MHAYTCANRFTYRRPASPGVEATLDAALKEESLVQKSIPESGSSVQPAVFNQLERSIQQLRSAAELPSEPRSLTPSGLKIERALQEAHQALFSEPE